MTRLKPGWFAGLLIPFLTNVLQAQPVPARVHSFLEQHCLECHDAEVKKGGLNLETLGFGLQERIEFGEWVKVVDKASAGEMPPKSKARPVARELRGFTNELTSALLGADRQRVAKEGRATQRRLNRYEYEESLQDLLSLPYLEVKSFLPED